MSLDENVYDSVLGLFSHDHMPYHLEAGGDDPTLSEMTQKAIQVLKKKKKGFFLFVEGDTIFFLNYSKEVTFFFKVSESSDPVAIIVY